MSRSSPPARKDRSSRPRAPKASSRFGLAAFPTDSNRPFVPLAVFAAVVLLFLARLVYLQVIVAPEYSAQAAESRTDRHVIEPRRGTIYDRNGVVLATNVNVTTIYADPTMVDDLNGAAAGLASVLGGDAKDYLGMLTKEKTQYSVIKKKVDDELADKVRDLDLKGIGFQADTKRVYPNGQVGGQVIGACSVDADEGSNREHYTGIAGLELYYNDLLSGTPGYYEGELGDDGTPIPDGVHQETPAVDGQDIVISLDIELQQKVEERLVADEGNLTAKGGNAIVMDGGTGEIYAAASLPLFNPADRSDVKDGSTKLKSVTDLFEPGSIFKSVSATAILEAGTMNPDSTMFCPSTLEADGYVISDAHARGDETLTLRQILDQSSNIGISLSTEKMGFQKLYDKINKYNLHTKTGVDYPGEGEEGTDKLGNLPAFKNWSKVTGYNVSFGQGLSLTPLQITRFYGALVNNGVECTPHFLLSKPQSGEPAQYDTQEVIDNKAAIPAMTDMLKTVVSEGTGKRAAIEGFHVAGKTSTAEIYDEKNGGYRKNVYNLAFIGFLADSSSQLVCFVGANEVPYDGVVTPIFKDIMTAAIDRFKITP